jgi:cytochrome P450
MQDFKFSDGTFVPKGTTVLTASGATQLDEAHYANATTFSPWRFVPAVGSLVTQKTYAVTPNPEYIPFGIGEV